ncbi:MAG: type II toxin-antitoxin system HicA family toxin [Candidatus Staskawiczbacteria bacterium]|nr:type II toxin-antitoxin system HicA family toxin [Candidatus Staskawiczbacteria bacterium]
MAKLPIISGKIAVKVFLKIGYRVVRQKGSHIRLCHETRRPLTIPNHKILGKGLIRKLLRDSQLSLEEFLELF